LPRRAADLTGLATTLLEGWQRRQVAVELIYQRAHGVGRYRAVVQPCLPLSLPTTSVEAVVQAGWPPIIETDGPALFRRVTEQWLVLDLVERLLESQVAEHAARFQLMEAASQNSERLVAELRLTVQTARRQAITRETQALAVGAGLLGSQPD
jgi:F0F1-type ATP synthase gamma subunit